MQEDIESLPLYLNPVLEPLAICLARGLFRDFKTADEIFSLDPPPGEDGYELTLSPSTAEPSGSQLGRLSGKAKNISKRPVSHRSVSTGPGAEQSETTPFFEKMSDKGPTGEILDGNWLDGNLSKLGYRAGYIKRISVHDMRAEALVRTNGKRALPSIKPNLSCRLTLLYQKTDMPSRS